MRAPIITQKRARKLRLNMTQPEETLWAMLREQRTGLRFRRQFPLGLYILDFYAPSAKFCIEVDGPSHGDPGQPEHDRRRDQWLNEQGIRIVRVTTTDIEANLAEVMVRVRSMVRTASD